VQLIGLLYLAYDDVNIVLRVRETDCTDGVQNALKRKQQNSRSGGVIYSRPRVLRTGKASSDVMQSNNYLLCGWRVVVQGNI